MARVSHSVLLVVAISACGGARTQDSGSPGEPSPTAGVAGAGNVEDGARAGAGNALAPDGGAAASLGIGGDPAGGAAAATGGTPSAGANGSGGDSRSGGASGVPTAGAGAADGGTGGNESGTGGASGATGATGGDQAAGAGAALVGGAGGTSGNGAAGGAATDDCEFVIELPELTRPPGTAVVVEWSVNLPSLESASIEFGRGGDYGDAEYVAPVDLLAPHYRTVLLGMKSAKDYQFRIIARSANRVCESEPQTVRSGYLRAGLPSIRVEPADLPVDGFSVTCDLSNQMLTGGVTNAYIFDADGDIVWNYYVDHWGDCTAARMSFDGRSMWIANANPRGARGSLVHVSMDGEQVDEFSLPDRHHDIAVLDDGKVAIIEYEDGDPQGCDVIRELDPVTGTSQTLFAVRDAVPSGDRPCTTNAIEYWPEQGLYTVSVSGSSRIVAFDRAGTLRWVFGGGEVDGASWDGQNAHSLFGDHLLFLAEQPAGQLLEFALDASGSSGTLVWEHTSEHPSVVVGDVARLANGNTLVTYGTAGVTEELDPDGAIVQQVTSGMACGSMTRRHTLYGPPPPYAE